MKIEKVPPPPPANPPVYYTLTLDEEQLTCLGVLSYRHETTEDGLGRHRFHALLPRRVQDKIYLHSSSSFPSGIWDR